SFNGSCVPASVAQIYNLYTGQNVSDLDFVELANQLDSTGWIVGPDGTPGLPADAAAQLLEAAGIHASTTYGSMDTLSEALAQGNAVMVAFDSGEVWYGEAVEDNTADHMAVVAAIDYDAGLVYLSDTGSPDGNMEAVPIEIFIDAWEDSGFLMVECTQTVDEYQSAHGITVGAAAEAPAEGHYSGMVAEDTIVQATSHQWALLPISGVTLAEAAAAHRNA
ncbi:MAG: C39 family peptidase, partial [Micrococcales bacterium]|nr:C39 family peptidase [Micrococcales bacterium]